MKTILFFIEVSCPGGAQNVLINILDRLDRTRYRPVVALLRKGWLQETLRLKGYEVVLLESTGRSFDWKLLKDLLGMCRRLRVDLIHSHLFDSGLYACLAGLLTGAPVIITLHGQVDWKMNSLPVIDRIKRTIINSCAHRIIYVSRSLRKHYEDLGLRRDRGEVIYNGIDTEYFTPVRSKDYRTRLGFSDADILIGAVGNVKPWKGYEYLLRAAVPLVRRHPRAKLLIAGEMDKSDDYSARLLEVIRENGLRDHVFFLGYRTDIKEVLSALDIFVLPSDLEGFSLSTIEAMAMGIPVVATRCGGPEEIVDNGLNGFLVPARDQNSLSERLEQLICRRSPAKETIQEAARTKVERDFSVNSQVSAYRNLYTTVMGTRR